MITITFKVYSYVSGTSEQKGSLRAFPASKFYESTKGKLNIFFKMFQYMLLIIYHKRIFQDSSNISNSKTVHCFRIFDIIIY